MRRRGLGHRPHFHPVEIQGRNLDPLLTHAVRDFLKVVGKFAAVRAGHRWLRACRSSIAALYEGGMRFQTGSGECLRAKVVAAVAVAGVSLALAAPVGSWAAGPPSTLGRPMAS